MQALIDGIGAADSRMLTALAAAMLQEVVSREHARQDKGSAEQQSGEAPLQQLKAEIAALLNKHCPVGSAYCQDRTVSFVTAMRQLSAV